VINPAVPTHLLLVVPSSAQVGEPATVTLKAENAQNQPVQGCDDSVQVTVSPDAKAAPSGSISLVNGVASFSMTFDAAGAQTVTVTDAASSLTATAPINVAASTPTPTPGPGTTTSSNWSGYAVETNMNNPQSGAVTAVSGSWNVPAVTGSGTAYCAVWVGIDGYSSSSVEQIGTESDLVDGKGEYSVWYEMYPQGSVGISTMSVSAGDSITASVQYVASGAYKGEFQLTITDTSRKNDTFTTYQGYSQAQRSSAEWIVEAPSSYSGVLQLANFGSVAFSSATATINGVTGPIDGSGWQAMAIDIANHSGTETSTSALTDANGASSFTETYTGPGATSKASLTGATSSAAGHAALLAPGALELSVAESLSARANTAQAATDEVLASFDLLQLQLGLV
jgi:hypothetical protein